MPHDVPVVLFVYARPLHLAATLESLRASQVPLIYAFSDGAASSDKEVAVNEVRRMLRCVDWCDLRLIERKENLGLGKSILMGVSAVLREHPSIIVFEDDLVCVSGTYQYLSAALKHYETDSRVLSVTGWTHPRVTPSNAVNHPYFDGRAECLAWGAWQRSWVGMDEDAWTLMQKCRKKGVDIYRYGSDLPLQAFLEKRRNIWAVRFCYLHILHGGLCMRPPNSLVEHLGFDASATNSSDAGEWKNPPLKECPSLPAEWPQPIENPECSDLWRQAVGSRHFLISQGWRKIQRTVAKFFR